MLIALDELKSDRALDFNMSYTRRPFFLRGPQENIDQWLKSVGVPSDSSRGHIFDALGWPKERMDVMFKQSGLDSNWNAQLSDTMDSHRLALYAATMGKGEEMWRATSRRFFEGKDTKLKVVRLADHALLMECAEECGLDLVESRRVLETDAFRKEVQETVKAMHDAGIDSIPVFIFQCDGQQAVHHGSGSPSELRAVLEGLHAKAAL